MGPIPWRDAILYADRTGLDHDMTDVFLHVIREMDERYLRWAMDQSKEAPKPVEPQEGDDRRLR